MKIYMDCVLNQRKGTAFIKQVVQGFEIMKFNYNLCEDPNVKLHNKIFDVAH